MCRLRQSCVCQCCSRQVVVACLSDRLWSLVSGVADNSLYPIMLPRRSSAWPQNRLTVYFCPPGDVIADHVCCFCQEGFWSCVSSVTDNSLCPVIFLFYLMLWFLASKHQCSHAFHSVSACFSGRLLVLGQWSERQQPVPHHVPLLPRCTKFLPQDIKALSLTKMPS